MINLKHCQLRDETSCPDFAQHQPSSAIIAVPWPISFVRRIQQPCLLSRQNAASEIVAPRPAESQKSWKPGTYGANIICRKDSTLWKVKMRLSSGSEAMFCTKGLACRGSKWSKCAKTWPKRHVYRWCSWFHHGFDVNPKDPKVDGSISTPLKRSSPSCKR